jgi:hypothetical protein
MVAHGTLAVLSWPQKMEVKARIRPTPKTTAKQKDDRIKAFVLSWADDRTHGRTINRTDDRPINRTYRKCALLVIIRKICFRLLTPCTLLLNEGSLSATDVQRLTAVALKKSTLDSPAWRRTFFVALFGIVNIVCRKLDRWDLANDQRRCQHMLLYRNHKK